MDIKTRMYEYPKYWVFGCEYALICMNLHEYACTYKFSSCECPRYYSFYNIFFVNNE